MRGPKPKLCSAQIAKIDSRMDCEKVTRNVAAAMKRSAGRSRSSRQAPRRDAIRVLRRGAPRRGSPAA